MAHSVRTVDFDFKVADCRFRFYLVRFGKRGLWVNSDIQERAARALGYEPARYCLGCRRRMTSVACKLKFRCTLKVCEWGYFHSLKCLKGWCDGYPIEWRELPKP